MFPTNAVRKCARSLAIGAGAAALLASAVPCAAAQDPETPDRDCFWQGGNRTANVAYPDLGARYWVSAFPLPPGTELILRGTFPHSRYFSFNVYDPALRPTDALPDADIVADPGSTNPFIAGADRNADRRTYTVRVVSGVPPEQREPNTVYLNAAGQAAVAGQIIYRVYVPDRGLDPSGGVGLPEVSLRLANGTELDQPATCAARDSGAGSTVDSAYANLDGPGSTPAQPIAADPIHWEAFFNYAQAFTYPLEATPAATVREIVPRDSQGGFLSNVDNAYTLAMADRGKGPVLVLHGRAPTVPPTVGGDAIMGTGQVRYWSLCENEFASQRVIDCLYDQQVQTDADGYFTIAMSTPEARPKNAVSECGVGWLRWGAQPDGFVILRHMLPSPDFAEAIQNVAELGTESDVIGEYLPVGKATTTADFEARGCKPPADPLPGACGGGAPKLGTSSGDRLVGTIDRDRIVGRGGRDEIWALAGADCLLGGKGADQLRAGAGKDVLRGGPGSDRMRGGPGHDRLRCGRGRRDVASSVGRRDSVRACERVIRRS